MKTVTQKELIVFYDLKIENERRIHDEGRKVLEWSEGSTKNKKHSSRECYEEEKHILYNNNAMNIVDMQVNSEAFK